MLSSSPSHSPSHQHLLPSSPPHLLLSSKSVTSSKNVLKRRRLRKRLRRKPPRKSSRRQLLPTSFTLPALPSAGKELGLLKMATQVAAGSGRTVSCLSRGLPSCEDLRAHVFRFTCHPLLFFPTSPPRPVSLPHLLVYPFTGSPSLLSIDTFRQHSFGCAQQSSSRRRRKQMRFLRQHQEQVQWQDRPCCCSRHVSLSPSIRSELSADFTCRFQVSWMLLG